MAKINTLNSLRRTSRVLIKEADAKALAKGLGKGGLGALKTAVGAGTGLYNQIVNLGWVLAPLAAGTGAVALAKMLSPEAVADNADKILINENQKEELAQSIRDLEALKKKKQAELYSRVMRQPHDRFIS